MKSKYISTLQVGDELLNEPFLLQDVVRRTTKDGRPYLLYTLRDKTGQAGGVFWDVPDYIEAIIKPGFIFLISGRVSHYKDSLQITTTDMNPSQTVDLGDFLPTSTQSRSEMVIELREYIHSLANPWQQLVAHILLDEAFLPRFVDAPAARSMHHAYIGGLLEHSLSMAKIAQTLAQHYPYVNKDLLITGALLHDMGKVEEYTLQGTFALSEDGRLVGHIIRAIILIEKVADQIDFPVKERQHLIHLIASHHGTHEWGSPTLPKTLEGILLHQIDLLDSRVQGFFDHINNDVGETSWTAKSSAMFKTELRYPDGLNPDTSSKL